MKSLIRWAIRNTPAMNTLMVGVIVVGAVSLASMHREVFPEFDLDIILVSVPYPGASPEEVEEGICQKIEEAVRSVEGIKKQNSVAREGLGTVILELESDVPDVQKILNEVRSEIDRIPSFPELAEDPEVKQITLRRSAIQVGVIGPDTSEPGAERELRDLAEEIRDELLLLEPVSQANLVGARPYQIDIEISEQTLREYGLTLQQVAQIVRRENLEMPGGSMKTDAQEMLLRGKNKRLVGERIAQIPLVTRPGGVVLTVGDLGRVRDEFDDSTATSRINGKPALVISVDKTSREDLLAITAEVKRFVAQRQTRMPAGYSLVTWADESVNVRDRMALLGRNGLQGLVLVLIVLTLFLEHRLAFWVALGIPISILGACGVMLYAGQTMNMLSMFAFLMALGILVDDAIVIGENIYAHRQRGSDYVTAAVEGTYEVLPSVLASVGTTIIAFAPMLFVPGIMGKFFAVIPFAVITMLLISLLESTFVLPCHLAHVPRSKSAGPGWINRWSDRLVGGLISRLYLPLLRRSLDHPLTVVAIGATVLLLTAGFYQGGFIPFQLFPRLDADTIQASVTFPDGTPAAITDEATRRLERAIQEINDEHARRGGRLATLIHRTVGDTGSSATMTGNPPAGGSHTGSVQVELVEGSRRSMKSHEIVMQWRKRAGEFPGVESLTFGSVGHGPGGAAVEFKLLGDRQNMAALEDAVELCKARLGKYQGTLDIEDDSRPGKWEFQLTVKDSAQAMGVPLADLAGTVRAAYYGEEVMRLQRGRHEVKLMVRYPPEERHSLAAFDDLRVRTGGGAERPLTELAHLDVRRGYSTINRLDQRRAITITADVDESVAEADKIVADLKEHFVPQLLAKPEFAGLAVRWEGQQEQSSESMGGLFRGFLIALVAMFALLTLEFRSYGQPLLILLIIPFGAVGAVVGHVIMGMPLSLFSLFGMVALSGVVVNDSIVLIDFINRRVRDGVPLKTALLDAGSRRFRAVALTSLTTVAGLMPILFETSFQAQFLIPMATSLSFGLSFATLLVLIMVPTWYLLYFRLTGGEVSPLQPEPVVDALEQPNDDELESPARAPWATDLPVGQAVPDRRNG